MSARSKKTVKSLKTVDLEALEEMNLPAETKSLERPPTTETIPDRPPTRQSRPPTTRTIQDRPSTNQSRPPTTNQSRPPTTNQSRPPTTNQSRPPTTNQSRPPTTRTIQDRPTTNQNRPPTTQDRPTTNTTSRQERPSTTSRPRTREERPATGKPLPEVTPQPDRPPTTNQMADSKSIHSVSLDLSAGDNSVFQAESPGSEIYESVETISRNIFSAKRKQSENHAPTLLNSVKQKLPGITKRVEPIEVNPQEQTEVKMPPSQDTNRSEGIINTIESISAKVHSINSIYDSNDKLIYSTRTSDYGKYVGEEISLWRNVIVTSIVPYVLFGVPVVTLYRGSSPSQPYITRTSKWIRYIFTGTLCIILNGIELLIIIGQNLYMLFAVLEPVYVFISAGKLSEKLVTFLIYLYELIPLVIGFNAVWIKGYNIVNIVRVLDNKIQTRNLDGKGNLSYLKSLLIAVLCVLAVMGASITSFEWKSANQYATETSETFYYHLIVRFFTMLSVIVYIAVLSGVQFRINHLNHHIRSLSVDIVAISSLDFHKIKNIYKQNADLVCSVNRTFNVLVSDVLLIVLISIFKDIFNIFLLITVLDSFSMSVKNGSQQVDDELIRKIPQWIALDLLTAVAKLYLILICIRKARRVNKEIRFNLLNLHDIAAEYVEKPNLIYQSFCLVKYYMEARIEREDDPAVLRLYAAEWIPCVKIR